MGTETLRLVSYNIHGAIGADGLYRPDRLASFLEGLGAGLFALQEVVHRGAQGRDLLDFLAERLGMHAIPGPTMFGPRGLYGNALLVPSRDVEVRRHDLSVPGREPRGAVAARVPHDAGAVWILSTHLGLRHAERRAQVLRLATWVDTLPDETTVLLGDFNDWRPRRIGTLQPLRARFRDEYAPATYPARRPLLALDRAFLRGPYRRWRGTVVRRNGAARVSDHLPLVVDVEPAG
ncbi:MAG: endonuclease/exonuclease/phosphatase family protein [Gammaproteobacteria bacterium]|nr:endonuclease/exonuclease/phosphatase family protein [Gammaproteobacteria bacterium]